MKKNIVANIVNKAWGFISVLAFTPLYLKLLGVEAYGLIGFYSTLLAMLAFADMGFTATLTREIARFDKNKKDEKLYILNLLRSYELLYMLISLFISISIWFLTPFIVNNWLNLSPEFNHQQALYAIRLMGIALALQLPSDLFFGGLMGLQQQVKANLIQISWGVFRAVGAVFVMYLVSPTIIVFAFWQLISNILYCIVIRFCLWKRLSQSKDKGSFDKQVFKNTWKYSLSMMFMSIISMCLTQSDKLMVSKMLPLKEFSYYCLAVSMASIPLVIANPVANAVFPKITGLIAAKDIKEMKCIYLKFTALVSVLVMTTALVLIIYSEEFIYAWTGSKIIAQYSYKIAIFLIIGQLLQSITVIPYYTALAFGNVKINLRVGVISMIFLLPLLVFMVNRYGTIGGGMAWAITNIVVTPIYMFFLHRKFLKDIMLTWLIRSIAIPFILISVFTCITKLFTDSLLNGRIQIFTSMIIAWLIVSATTYVLVLKNKYARNFNID